MTTALSMFSAATSSVRDSFCSEVRQFLQTIGAQQCPGADTRIYTDLPLLAEHEKHLFELDRSRTGWMDLIQRKDTLLQFVINLQYPKRRWFSSRSKDWKQLIAECTHQFGPGHSFDMEGKTCLHFHDQSFKLLLTLYETRKHHFIEIKMAKGQFCY